MQLLAKWLEISHLQSQMHQSLQQIQLCNTYPMIHTLGSSLGYTFMVPKLSLSKQIQNVLTECVVLVATGNAPIPHEGKIKLASTSRVNCMPTIVTMATKVTRCQQAKDFQPEKMHLPHASSQMKVCKVPVKKSVPSNVWQVSKRCPARKDASPSCTNSTGKCMPTIVTMATKVT